MGAMFRQMFIAITTIFASLEKLAKASDHLSTWAEESAGAFADEARMQRQAKLRLLQRQADAEVVTATTAA